MIKTLLAVALALAALPAEATTKVDARMMTGIGAGGEVTSLAWSSITGRPSAFPAMTPVATATALAAAPTTCGAGQSARGIDASGNATGCFTPASAYTLPAATASVLGGMKGGGSCGLECCDGYTLKGLNSDGSIKCQAVGAALATVVSCDGAPPADTAQLFFIDATGSPYCAGLGTPTAAAPVFSPVAATYSGTQSVTITSGTSGATICYTVAGATPAATTPGTCDGGSNTYSTPVSVASSLTLKAIATKAAYVNSGVTSGAYTITIPQAAAPTFSPVAGAVADGSTITVTSGTSGATLYLDPFSPPTTARATATISGAATWYAQAKKASYTDSTIASAVYTLTGGGGDVTAPSVTAFTLGSPTDLTVPIASFTATDAVGVTEYVLSLSSCPAAGAAGWVGTAPTSYTFPTAGTYTLRGCAKDAAGNVSTGLTAGVTVAPLAAATPTFSPVAGAVVSGSSVTISTATSGCSGYIYWNTTGSPTTGDTHTTSATVSTAETVYAKVIGCPGYADSAVASAAYTLSAASLVEEGSWASAESTGTMTVAVGSGTAGRLLVAVVAHSASNSSSIWKATVSGGSGLAWSRAGGGTDAIASGSGWVDIWTAVDTTGGALTVSAAPYSPGDAPGRTWVAAVTGSTGVRQIAGSTSVVPFVSTTLSTSLIFGGAVNWASATPPALGAGDSYLTGSAGTSAYGTSDGAGIVAWKRAGDGATTKASGPLTGNINAFGAVEIKL